MTWLVAVCTALLLVSPPAVRAAGDLDVSGRGAAIMADGSLWIWGDHLSGDLAGYTLPRPSPARVGDGTWAWVSSSLSSTAAVRADGSLWMWGRCGEVCTGDDPTGYAAEPVPYDTRTDWRKVWLGPPLAALALDAGGRLWSLPTWGPAVQLGTAQDWADAAGGEYHFLARKTDGSLWAWGENVLGELGLGFASDRVAAPTQVGSDKDWVALAAGQRNSAAIKADGSLWTWGWNWNGQLGHGDVGFRSEPTRVPGETAWRSVDLGSYGTLAVAGDGTLWGCGRALNNVWWRPKPAITTFTRLGAGTEWTAVAAGGTEYAARKVDGSVWTWGWGPYTGTGTPDHAHQPARVSARTDWAKVSAGTDHSLAIREDGSLWVWGGNTVGELGLGDCVDRARPVRLGTHRWRTVAAGNKVSVGIRADGTLWAWGWNGWGQPGQGVTWDQRQKFAAPVQIGRESTWRAVSPGYTQVLALKEDGSLWGWGDNRAGALGLGVADEVVRTRPQRVGDRTDWAAVDGGFLFSAALDKEGNLWGWGDPSQTFLPLPGSLSPILWAGGLGASRLGAGYNSLQAYAPRGDFMAWTYESTWDDSDVVQSDGGMGFQLAVKGNGTLWGACGMGFQDRGQMQNRGEGCPHLPVRLGADADWSRVAAGAKHTVAIKRDGSLWSWGFNELGQLGNGRFGYVPEPVMILPR